MTMLGALGRAVRRSGHQGVDSSRVRPDRPPNPSPAVGVLPDVIVPSPCSRPRPPGPGAHATAQNRHTLSPNDAPNNPGRSELALD